MQLIKLLQKWRTVYSAYTMVLNKTFNDGVEKKSWKKYQKQRKGKTDLTPQEQKKAFKRDYNIFVLTGLSKVDIDGYVDWVRPHI